MHSPSVLTASAVARCFFCMVMDSGKGTSSSLSNYQMANNSLLFDCIVDATQLIRENTATFGHHQRHGSTQHLYLQKSTEMKCSGETTHTIIVLIASSLAHCFFCMIMDSGKGTIFIIKGQSENPHFFPSVVAMWPCGQIPKLSPDSYTILQLSAPTNLSETLLLIAPNAQKMPNHTKILRTERAANVFWENAQPQERNR